MISPELISVMRAINAGDKARARQLLQPLLKDNPTAELWYQAARVAEKPEHELTCLRQALGLDPYHIEARRRYRELQAQMPPAIMPEKAVDEPQRPDPPARMPLTSAAQAVPVTPAAGPEPRAPLASETPLKTVRRRRRRGAWFYVGITASILLSLSASYFVMLVLGSPLPGRLRALLGAETPVTEIGGVPLEQIPDAVFKIAPSRSTLVTQTEPRAEILEPGIVHEYTFEARSGEEVAIGIQFFSPTAQRVSRNIAILDPEGRDAQSVCQRDRILQGDNGAVIICSIHRSGTWQVRLLGRENESSGAYVVSVGRIYS